MITNKKSNKQGRFRKKEIVVDNLKGIDRTKKWE